MAISCKRKDQITIQIAMMRMWQLGNMDIKQVSEEGVPIFILTATGIEKINQTEKEKWFEVLLWDTQKQIV
ncbi:hypothetical protein [Prochlorococcus sp. MIT 1307]|uniref:hypothetical protein n=1 Tax=Prochlorococcus sp. MIT 1307 TaxID=3096219 RepID=UPI002A757D4D|nr:hypothetical protein [Prochlorococcus sp. MIT 1307]